MTAIIFFISGLIAGHFLNVCIHGIIGKESADFSFWNPVVEMIAGVIFAMTALALGDSPELFMTLLFFSCLIVIAFVDWKTMGIPFGLHAFLFMIGIANLLFANTAGITSKEAVLSVLASSGFLLLLYLLGFFTFYNELTGIGSIKLFVPICFYLGMERTLLCMYLSIIIGGVTVVCMQIRGKKKNPILSFGSCIVSGTITGVLYGESLLKLYYRYLYR